MIIPSAAPLHLCNLPRYCLTLPGKVQDHVDPVHQRAQCTANKCTPIILLDTMMDTIQVRHGPVKNTEESGLFVIKGR